MTFEIKQNGEFITLNSFDEQYCTFTGEELRSDIYGSWFSPLEFVFNTWGDIADYTDEKYSRLRKKMNIKKEEDERAISAKDAAHCLMVWVALTYDSIDDIQKTLEYFKPIVDFFNSLEDTTFYFSF